MRILHVVLKPRYSGAEIVVRDLALVHRAMGEEVSICAMAPTEDSFTPELERLTAAGVSLIVPERRLGRWGRIKHLRSALREYRPDIVFAHSELPAVYTRLAAAGIARSRVVVVLHAAANFSQGVLRIAERLLSRHTAGVIAVAQPAADAYRSLYGHAAPLRVVPNGITAIPIQAAASKRDHYRRTFGIPHGARLILQVGRVLPVKQQHLTLDALGNSVSDDERLLLWFAGDLEDSAYVSALQEQIERQGIGRRAVLLGARRDVPALLAASDVVVMPSLREAQGLSFLEGLASGRAVVASNIAPFMFAAALPGVQLVDPSDLERYRGAVLSALVDSTAYERNLEEFSVETMAERYLEFAADIVRPDAARL